MGKDKKIKENNSQVNAPINDALGNADLSTTNKPVPKKNANNKDKKDKKPNIFARIGRSFKEMFSEMKKVTWADGKTVVASTFVVLGVVFIFFICLLGIDSGLAALLNLLLNH